MSDHFDGRRFVNPAGTAGQPYSEVPRMLREPRTPWPKHVKVRPQVPPALDGAAAVVTFIDRRNKGATTEFTVGPEVTVFVDVIRRGSPSRRSS